MGRIYLPGRSDRMNQLLHRYPLGLNTVLLLHSDDADGSQTFVDSINAREFTNAGSSAAEHKTAKQKFGASSIYFDNTAWLTLLDNADWDAGASDFTYDFWVLFSDVSADQGIMSKYTNDTFCWCVRWDYSEGKLIFSNINGVSVNDVKVTFNPVANVWYHIALIRGWDGNNDHMTFCVNGTEGEVTDVSTPALNMAPTNTGTLNIGRSRSPADTCNFRGYIDELRMDKGHAIWTANFTPPQGMYI
jgi:hypothetical protein